jgi:two-component system OmpR family response regulator
MLLLGRDDPDLRRRVLLIGVNEGRERARLLRLGFGDVTGSDVGLAEIDSRAERLAAHADLLPRRRRLGPLVLDLFSRDGEGPRGRLGLHPREFALLWRLAEAPGRRVGKAQLAADVWRLGFVPETNSIAVHVSRLRAKLAIAGLDGLVRTAPDGGYLLDRRLAWAGVEAGPAGAQRRKWDAAQAGE